MDIVTCSHIALLVSDLARSERFYGQVLGLANVERAPLNFPGSWYQLGADLQLHLIVRPDWQAAVPNTEKWGRNPHLALTVADLETAKAQLQAAGVSFQMSASGRAALFARDPDGNILELSQA